MHACLCAYVYIGMYFSICRLYLFVFVVSSIMVFSCNIGYLNVIVYCLCDMLWTELGQFGVLVVWKSFSMSVNVWCYLEDPLENEMFHLKGLSSNKMMTI